jgi:hypothetical protein
MDLDSDGNMHGGGIGVVAALALVHVIIRMHRLLATQLTFKQTLTCTLRIHLAAAAKCMINPPPMISMALLAMTSLVFILD